jgi:thiosulfate/3-mercaptopyruvate sulfurtransferase
MEDASGPLVDAAWLERNLGDPDLVVADVRWRPDGSAEQAFEEGHILGAVLVDVDRDLAAPAYSGPGRHPLPPPAVFAERMSVLGIGNDDTVVAYDDASSSHAARLWWMLRVTGHRAFVLDGGLASWRGHRAKGSPVERNRRRFLATPWPRDRIATAEDVRDLLDRGGTVLDARARERYRADVEPIDRVAGHIPGARNAPFAENVDAITQRFRSPEELRATFDALGTGSGPSEGDGAIVYCGSGLTATQLIVAFERAGLPSPRLYEGSWSDWIGDPERPVATGPEP